jgi:hypothetical protein
VYGTVLSRPNRYLDAMDRYIRDAIERAQDAVMGSHLARTEALRLRHAWGAWRAQWAEIEATPLAERMLTVCMYCERFRVTTGEWVAATPDMTRVIRDRTRVNLTHGVCPICLAGKLDEPAG